MQLTVVAHHAPTQLTRQWASALASVRIQHPNRVSKVQLKLTDAPMPLLEVGLDWTHDTVTGARRDRFMISTVRLSYFPGARLAQAWIAAAWAGYCEHEALEMVTADGGRPIDPHREIDGTHRLAPFLHDRGLRDGLPHVLTPETLLRTLCVVMDEDVARAMVGRV